MMKTIFNFYFVLFSSFVVCKKLDFDYKKLKDIWESHKQQNFTYGLKKFDLKPAVNARILNGSDVKQGQFPHHFLIYIESQWYCGGSLISPNWILTVEINK